MVVLEILVVVLLILLNGFFAFAEFSIVSSRRGRLEQLAADGKSGARTALSLADDPARVLATVQIGMTLTQTLAGAFSGATLAERLEDWLAPFPLVAAYGKPVAVAAVVIIVVYLTLIIGELVPKNVALVTPEAVATRIARPLAWFARAAAPLVFLLDASTRFVLRCMGVRPGSRQAVTEEDIHSLVAEGARLGVIHRVEHDMIEGVLDLADSAVRTIMTPRPAVVWVDLDDPRDAVVQKIAACPHAQILVCRGSIDEPVGVVRKQDLFDQYVEGRAIDVEQAMHAPLIVPEATSILRTLDLFRNTPVHTALVVDEYGSVQGIATRTDLLEAVAGDLPKINAPSEPKVTKRDDGSLLVDGAVPIRDVAGLLALREPPPGDFVTLAGFVLSRLHRIPKSGEHVTWNGWRFEVVDMDGRRIDKVLIERDRDSAKADGG
jgi:putative hemolysin